MHQSRKNESLVDNPGAEVLRHPQATTGVAAHAVRAVVVRFTVPACASMRGDDVRVERRDEWREAYAEADVTGVRMGTVAGRRAVHGRRGGVDGGGQS